ncbi:unnamed protein product [Triticum turgidum subsp. durum]|uniref:Uncharacterized protein n=1 Tax=Triticum turgidum subsp. durum TaxID=4567 RepID=A0A9R1AGT7_TRITD|nr:unnamed protein product [Triticum turgidum subsp. durum]
MTEIKLPNIQKAASSDYWSLASSQYPSGKFPKVSIGIPIPRTGSRDAAAAPAFERNPSQGTDGRSRPPKGYNASLRVSQEAANHGGSATEAPEAAPVKGSLSQPDHHAPGQTGTFSFGTRKEQDSQLDQSQNTPFLSSQGRRQVESADKTKPNSEVLRMKLWGILGTSQTKQAVASPNPEDIGTPDQPKSLTANGPSSGNKKVYTSPFPDNIKTPDLLKCQTATYAKSKPSSDPIESDSDTPQVVEIRPVTRTLGRKKAPAASKKQDKSQSAKKPLSTKCSAPKQKTLDNVFVFDEKCTPKTAGKSANGNSGCLRNLRSSNRKAKVELQKVNCSSMISDKITPDGREGRLSSRNAPSENKGEKTTSFSSLSRTGKTAESCSRSPTREKRLNGMAKVEPQKMQSSEKLLSTTLNEGEDKLSSQNISSKSKANYSSLLHHKENANLSKASDRNPQAHKAAGNNFKSPPSGAASPSPDPKMYPWDNEASPQINGKLGEKFASPLANRFADMQDEDQMDKTDELPNSESPNSPEERESKKQPNLSPIAPTEDEMAQTSIPSFGKVKHYWQSSCPFPEKKLNIGSQSIQ